MQQETTVKFLAIKLFIVSIVMFAATSAFASLGYDVSLNTTSLNGQDGYLYFSYTPINGVDSTATITNFSGGTLLAQSTNVVDGSAVSGTLPGSVVFANTYATNDYNHAITFGNKIDFNVLFAANAFGGPAGGSNTFSLGLFSDEAGLHSLLGGTVLTLDLNNDGTTAFTAIANEASATPTPIPAAAYLLGSGLMGLVGMRRRKNA